MAGLKDAVELDIADALRQIDRIGQELTSVTSDRSIDVTARTAGIADEITSAVDAADTSVTVDVDVPTVTVNADAADVTGSIDAAVDAADTSLIVTGDTSDLTGDITAAIDNADTFVTITGDASELTGDITAAVDAADASVNIDGEISPALAAGLGSAAGKAEELQQSSAGAEAALVGMGSKGSASLGKLGRAAAGIIGIDLIAGQLQKAADAASDLNESTSKSSAVFGQQADAILGWSTTSADAIGLTQQQALEASATFGNLFTSMGQTREEAAKLSPEIVTLGSDLASFGNRDIGEVLDALRSGLVGETEPLRNLGIVFNATDVERKALELGLGSLSGELTEGAKIQARYALIMERSSTAQGDFERTSGGMANQLRILQAEFGNAAAEAGQALLPVVLELIGVARKIIPVIAPLGQLFAAAFQALTPLLSGIVGVAAPLLARVATALQGLFVALIPVMDTIGQSLMSALLPAIEGLQPALDAVVQLLNQQIEAWQPIIDLIPPLSKLFGQVLGVLVEGAALTLMAVVDVLGRLFDIASPIVEHLVEPAVQFAKALGLVDEEAEKAAGSGLQFANVSSDIINSADALAKALQEDSEGFAAFIQNSSEFQKAGLLDALRRTGIEMVDLEDDLGNLDKGLKDFTATAIEAGQVRITIDGAAVSAQQIRELDGTLTDYLNTSGAVVTNGQELVSTFIAQQQATEAEAQAQFLAITQAKAYTDEQIRAIGVQAQQTLGVDSYTNRLQILAQQQIANQEAEAQQRATLEGNASAWVALTGAIATGTINTQNAAQAAAILGVDVATATQFINDAQVAIDSFVANALAKFPSVTTVFDDLKNAANPNDPASLTNSLNLATLASLNFQANIDKIAEKFPEVARVLQEKGPEAAGAFAQTFIASSDEVKTNLEEAIKVNQSALGTISQNIKDSIGTNVATAKQLAGEMTAGLDENLKFDEVTEQSIKDAQKVLTDATVIDPLKADAELSGRQIGDALAAGVAFGLGQGSPLIDAAARETVRRAKEQAEKEAGIRSPSRVFATIGEQMGAGMALGLEAAQARVVAEAEAIVAAAAEATANQALAVPVATAAAVGAATGQGSAVPAGGTLVSIDQFTVAVTASPGVTPAEAEEQGSAAGRGFIAAIKQEAWAS